MMMVMMMKYCATTPDTAHRSKSVKFLEAAQDIGLQVLIWTSRYPTLENIFTRPPLKFGTCVICGSIKFSTCAQRHLTTTYSCIWFSVIFCIKLKPAHWESGLHRLILLVHSWLGGGLDLRTLLMLLCAREKNTSLLWIIDIFLQGNLVGVNVLVFPLAVWFLLVGGTNTIPPDVIMMVMTTMVAMNENTSCWRLWR